jgi:SAM-dependent methyltransferase
MTITEAFNLINNESLPRHNTAVRWADLGSGSGLFTLALSRLLQKGSIIYGIDRAASLQRQATANGVEIIPLKLDFINDGLALKELDGILMANALHYVKNKVSFLQRLKTYMQPAGQFLIVEYDTDIAVPTWVPYPVSFSSLTKLFKDAGYTRIQKLGERPSIYGRGNIYSVLLDP